VDTTQLANSTIKVLIENMLSRIPNILVILTIPTYILNEYQPELIELLSSFLINNIPAVWQIKIIPAITRSMVTLNFSFAVGLLIIGGTYFIRSFMRNFLINIGLGASVIGMEGLRESVINLLLSAFIRFSLYIFTLAYYSKILLNNPSILQYLESTSACWVSLYPVKGMLAVVIIGLLFF
jgi:hypothetical protein